MVKTSAPEAEGPEFESSLLRDFSGSSHTSDLRIGTPVATLPGACLLVLLPLLSDGKKHCHHLHTLSPFCGVLRSNIGYLSADTFVVIVFDISSLLICLLFSCPISANCL